MNDLFKNDGTGNCQSEEIKLYDFNGSSVRVVKDEKGEPWFVAKDVCEYFGESHYRRALMNIDSDERGVTQINTPGGMQPMGIVSEHGLYDLLFAMQPTKARGVSASHIAERQEKLKAFKRWVTHEVLPEIRKTGGYVHATPEMTDDEIMARALQVANKTIERKNDQIREQQRLLQEQAPAVEYCNEVLSATNLHTINSIAVHLGISAIRLNKFLVDHGLIYKQGDIYCPSFKIRGKGYCDFHVVPYINSNGERMTREHLKWTETGRQFIINLYKEERAS